MLCILLNLLAVAAESFGLLLMIPLLKQLFFDSATSDPISSTIYHVPLYRFKPADNHGQCFSPDSYGHSL